MTEALPWPPFKKRGGLRAMGIVDSASLAVFIIGLT